MSEPRGESKTLLAFIVGVTIGMVLFAVAARFSLGSYLEQAHKAKDACEANLPRNQRCVITAVPELDTGRAK